MSRVSGPYHIYRRPDTKRYQLTIYPVSGLPSSVCAAWVSKSFANLPPELAQYREPHTRAAAEAGATLLIDYIKRRLLPAPAPATEIAAVNAGKLAETGFVEYLLGFWSADSPYIRRKAKIDGEALSMEYIATNRRDVEKLVAPFPGFRDLPLGALTSGLVEDWMLWAVEDKGMSGRRINAVLGAMRVPVRYAVRRQELKQDPFTGVDRAQEKMRERGILTQAEVKALGNAPVKSERDWLAIMLALFCGMMCGEVRGLQWGDIGDGVISISHNWQDREGVKGPKRGSERVVPMPRLVADALNRLFGGGKAPTEFVFERGISGKPVGYTYFKGAFRRELAAIGIAREQIKARHLTYHGLRHTYITLARMAGISDLEIQALGGYKNWRMLERYSHVPQVGLRRGAGEAG
jgi:integrase